jgi:hypothetical protein
VRGEDRHGHQQDAQGAVRASLLHGGPHQGRWRVEKEDLPVGEAAGRTDAPRPVGYAQRVDDLGARLMELAPKARGPRIGLGRKGVHSDSAPTRLHRGARDEGPQRIRDRRAEDGVHVHIHAEVRAGPGGAVDALGHEGEARDVIGQEVHVRRSRGPIEP